MCVCVFFSAVGPKQLLSGYFFLFFRRNYFVGNNRTDCDISTEHKNLGADVFS